MYIDPVRYEGRPDNASERLEKERRCYALLDSLQIRPNIQYILRDDPSILAMVSNGLGISIMPELELEHCPYPLVACPLPQSFYRNIGIAVKDKNALSLSTRRFIEHARRWVGQHYEN